MFESLPEISSAVKALALVLFLIAAVALVAWLVRRYTSDRSSSAARGRQPRLAVVDAASMNDGRRKLVIIRRDNVEHLLMIGGPTDVVVEQNIVRAAGASREKVEPTLGRGPAISETLTRPVPLGEGSAFPLQPETNGRPPRALPDDPMQWTWPAPQVEPPRRAEPRLEKPEPPINPLDEAPARPTVAREPSFGRPATPPPASRPAPTSPAPAPAAEKAENSPAAADTDQNLAEMASMLESSLRRPVEMQAPEPLKTPTIEPVTPLPAPRPAPAEPKPASNEPKAVFESLEEEMASLLGRPPGKA
jgi:hypothetical protein